MIDTEHLDMDTIDNEYDTLTRLYDFGKTCILCGKTPLSNCWYCAECAAKEAYEVFDKHQTIFDR